MRQMKTALVVDDVVDAQLWLSQAIRTVYEDIELFCAGSLEEADALLASNPAFDIALVDLGLPDGSGVELIARLNRQAPQTLCVVASIYDDNEHLFPALRAGAHGYLLKDQPLSQIVELLKGVAEGCPPLSPAIARKMIAFFKPEEPVESPQLTQREVEVLRCIAKGMTLPETARLLGISPHTTSGYVKNIYRKLNICSRAEAAMTARNLGII